MKVRNRLNQRGYTLAELVLTIGALASLALFIGGIYVIIHFIAKFW